MKKLTPVQKKKIMDKILEVRYNDLELERTLCLELLSAIEVNEDSYTTAFAHTYLGDYYVAMGNVDSCATHLLEARDLAIAGKFDDILGRVCCLLGLYYEMIADGQSLFNCFMDGIAAARRVNDTNLEGLILNNIADNFYRNCGYEQALRFYKEAYVLIESSGGDNSSIIYVVLSNIAAVSICLGQLEEGKAYIIQCQARGNDAEVAKTLCALNWCQYYAAVGDELNAIKWAECVLPKEEPADFNLTFAFDLYSALFRCMMKVRYAPYAQRILMLMQAYYDNAYPEQRRQIEDDRMQYCLMFENDENKLDEAYLNYCHQTLILNKLGDNVITGGMKDTIRLFNVKRQKDRLNELQSDLMHQVNLDELTKVYTRRYLYELIRHQENNLSTSMLGVIMVDVDCLKEYNDTYGHPAGDEVLRTVGKCLRTHASDKIHPCRFGGDEFICLCVDATDEEIVNYLNTVLEDLQERNILHNASSCAQRVTLSIGFSNSERSKVSVDTLLEWADKALYKSKIDGRNMYSSYKY